VGDIASLWALGAFRRAAEDPEKIWGRWLIKKKKAKKGSRKFSNFKAGG